MEFRVYDNLLELRFDYENALNLSDVIGTKFYFVYARTPDETVKPIYIEYVDGSGTLQRNNAEEIVKVLGYMPILKVPMRDDAFAKGFAKAYIHNKTLRTMRRTNDIDDTIAEKANTEYNQLISSKELSTTENVLYTHELEELSSLHPQLQAGIGIVVENGKTLLSKSKSVCEQAYNGISNYERVVLLVIDKTLGSIGQFYVDNGKPVPPPHEEHLAIIKNNNIITDYFFDV